MPAPHSRAASNVHFGASVLVATALLACLPFDVIGGARIVRQRPSMMTFSTQWARGVAVQLAGFVLLQFLLAALRAPLARLIAAFNAAPLTARVRDIAQRAGIAPERLVVLETSDEGFVGGWSGIAPRTLLLPARWVQLPDEALGFIVVIAMTGAELGAAAGMLTMAAGGSRARIGDLVDRTSASMLSSTGVRQPLTSSYLPQRLEHAITTPRMGRITASPPSPARLSAAPPHPPPCAGTFREADGHRFTRGGASTLAHKGVD